ncbi:hypothetical protein N0V95_008471 [Ascochyta clinopodiicola]|nr:hypothetical protein N0V95_008471 [Ascochyta clinopodiicola]
MAKYLLFTLIVYFFPLARATTWIFWSDYPLPTLNYANRTLAQAESNRGPPWTPGRECPRVIEAYRPQHKSCSKTSKLYGCRFDAWENVHSALTHCPGVEELDLNLGRCDPYSSSETGGDACSLPFQPSGNDRYPNLRKLRVSGYDFGGPWSKIRTEGPTQAISELMKVEDSDLERWEEYVRSVKQATEDARRPRNETIEKSGQTNLDPWLKAMNWGKLEDLEITSLDFVKGLQNTTLTSLKWVGRTKPNELNTLLAHQGQSLLSLEYRCDEVTCLTFPAHSNIHDLTILAPQLQHLTINMQRNDSWPWQDLAVLSRMPNLQTATLYFRMQSSCSIRDALLKATPTADLSSYFYGPQSEARKLCQGPAHYQAPYLNHTAAADMFAYMRNNKQGAELQSVVFMMGDWSPSPSLSYIAQRRSRVRCSVVEGREVCRAENEKYWLGRYGMESAYFDEGGTWYGERWLSHEERRKWEGYE